MSRIKDAFKNGKAFIPFVTGGDPDLETTEKLVIAMAKAGADVIEIGLAFSDPVAEGLVIQAASKRALDAGTTTDKLFDSIKNIRKEVDTPLIIMTYINPVYAYGFEKFFTKCKEVGVDGIIVPDIPYEEKHEVSDVCEKYGVDFISMVAPTSNDRIKTICSEATGFIYCVSSLGVTGVRSEFTANLSG
ncbi:MAG: tryptophan synthase subunit alpha, partial [Lachnospiraceae bacterium]|nr:tryptophan synthase subunit alpha [Lachnospiraceae bacterium]